MRSPWRWRRPVPLAVVVTMVVAAVVVVARYRPGDTGLARTPGQRPAPTFAVPDLRDQKATIELTSLRGRPVVLNFWASWCVPCRREMPAFQAVHRRLGERVAFLGMNHQDGRRPALAFLDETGTDYPSGYDPEGKVAAAYGLVGLPTTVFISADARILATRRGEMGRAELEDAIEELFRP